MMQPPPMPVEGQGRLRENGHPDMSSWLTHFCARSGSSQPDVPPEITNLSAPERLDRIIREDRLRAFPPFTRGDPVVCLTEATFAGLHFLVRENRYQPWGLVLHRQIAYNLGGGPVWHVREEEWDLHSRASARQQARMVKLAPGKGYGSSDWLWEREWRIPVSGPAEPEPSISLRRLGSYTLIVDGRFWPRPYADPGAPEHLPGLSWAITQGMHHWVWNGQTFTMWPPPHPGP